MSETLDRPSYASWQDAALGGNLLSYAWANRPSMNELVPGYDPAEGGLQKALDAASIPARVATNALLGPIASGGAALDAWMKGNQGSGVRQQITQAVLGLLGSAGAPVRPAGSLGVFGGEKALLGKGQLHMLNQAKDMAYEGAHPEDIWHSTGWFKGVDGNWRFEIPDEDAAFMSAAPLPEPVEQLGIPELTRRPLGKSGMTTTYASQAKLGDILDHPALFSAYPELRDVTVKDIPLGLGHTGAYYAGSNAIELASPVKPVDLMTTILHEVQHVIQQKEGFQRGGNPRQFSGDPQENYRAYQLLAGEVESRLAEERYVQGEYQKAPWLTTGYPTENQIGYMPVTPEGHRFYTVLPLPKGWRAEPVDHDPFTIPEPPSR